MSKIFVKPGLQPNGAPFLVRHPDLGRRYFEPDGEDVESTTYVRRHIIEGGLVESNRPGPDPKNTTDTGSAKSGKGKD